MIEEIIKQYYVAESGQAKTLTSKVFDLHDAFNEHCATIQKKYEGTGIISSNCITEIITDIEPPVGWKESKFNGQRTIKPYGNSKAARAARKELQEKKAVHSWDVGEIFRFDNVYGNGKIYFLNMWGDRENPYVQIPRKLGAKSTYTLPDGLRKLSEDEIDELFKQQGTTTITDIKEK